MSAMSSRNVDSSVYGIMPTSAAVGSFRQVKDKRYWLAQLQMKMHQIQRETETLASERETMQRELSAKRSFEVRVQEAAKKLTGN